MHYVKFGFHAAFAVNVGGVPVIAFRSAECNDFAFVKTRNGSHGIFVVPVDYYGSVSVRAEFAEGLDYIVKIFEVVKMILVYVQNHSRRGFKIQEMILELAGLAYHDIAFPGDSAAMDKGELSSYDRAYVQPLRYQYLGYHGCNGSLAVGTAYVYGVAELLRQYS